MIIGTQGKQQHLRLVFATHEVLIRGNALRRIETTMQRMELSFLSAMPSSQRKLIAEGQPVIVEIIATEACRQHKRSLAVIRLFICFFRLRL